MAYEMKEGDFSIFPNDKKEPDSNQPDWTGKCMIDGVVKRVAGWDKKMKNDFTFISGKISEFKEKKEETPF